MGGPTCSRKLSKLNIVRVMSCHKLSYLFSSFIVENLGQLKVLIVGDCDSVEEIVAVGGEEMTEEKLLLLIDLQIIPILDIYHFVRDDLRVRYRNSDGELYILYPELFGGGSHVFPVALLQAFQHLKKFVVERSNLEKVLFRSDLQLINPGDDEDSVAKILARIQSLELAGLPKMTCHATLFKHTTTFFPSFVRLIDTPLSI